MDDLALLGDLDPGISRGCRLREDCFMRRAAASTHGSTPAMKDSQCPSVAGDDRRDRLVRAVERPGGTEIAALLVAVRIAEHHLLDPAAPVELSRIQRIAQQRLHRCGGAL